MCLAVGLCPFLTYSFIYVLVVIYVTIFMRSFSHDYGIVSFYTRAAAGGAGTAGGLGVADTGSGEVGTPTACISGRHRDEFSCRDGWRIPAAAGRSGCLGAAFI